MFRYADLEFLVLNAGRPGVWNTPPLEEPVSLVSSRVSMACDEAVRVWTLPGAHQIYNDNGMALVTLILASERDGPPPASLVWLGRLLPRLH